ncbi:MAG: thioesterase family protein, partial [Deinococcales bacterium]
RFGRLHPVYATYWLTKHVELVSRKIILPFLEPGEEGIGHAVSVTHLASALPGMRVRLTARFTGQEGNRVFADVRAVNELGDVVGEGSTTQVILPAAKLEAAFTRLRERWTEAATEAGDAARETSAGGRGPVDGEP